MIDFEQELYNRFGMVKDFTLGMRIAQAFYDLGCCRTAERYDEMEYNRQRAEEIVPNDLEEAAEEYSEEHSFHPCDYDVTPYDCFIAGAKWQAANTPLSEDTVLFNKGVEEGKRLMMQEAVEATVDGIDSNYIEFCNIEVRDIEESLGIETGDKVRIIIVKE